MIGYLAPEGYLPQLLQELKGLTEINEIYERLVLTSGPLVSSVWAQNVWLNPRKIEFQSISQAVQILRDLQRNWALYSTKLHRRAHLIAEKLPKVSGKPFVFPSPLPKAPMGSWTLIENNVLIASTECSSLFPNGEIHFKEDKEHPPSRAYLKLWESLALAGRHPQAGDRCLDLGSSPGGWTWALHELGANVVSIDRAPLTPEITALPRVEYLAKDAFTLDPQTVGPVDWLFSDVICYPERLYELIQKWIEAKLCNNFNCTIKFQGKEISSSDLEIVRAFADIPGSSVRHLYHNKNELTWSLHEPRN